MRTIKPYTKKGRPFIMRDMPVAERYYNSPATPQKTAPGNISLIHHASSKRLE